mgnify:CR=1 FL=1
MASMDDTPMLKEAFISPCGLFRPVLSRRWDNDLPTASFYGVNPSYADKKVNDPTVRKMFGFCVRLGYGGFRVGNLIPYRATYVKDLKTVQDPFGDYGNVIAHPALLHSDTHIAAWGNISKLPKHLRYREAEFAKFFEEKGIPLHCIGTTKNGHPKHPLMTGYNVPLTPWSLECLDTHK